MSAPREAGHTWRDIGTALGLRPGGGAQQAGETVAEAAFTYTTGHLSTEQARGYSRIFDWTCPTCDEAISDHGFISGPAYDEHGHAANCDRLAATIAAADAQWEPDWESRPVTSVPASQREESYTPALPSGLAVAEPHTPLRPGAKPMATEASQHPPGKLACSVSEVAHITGLSRDLLYDQMRTGRLAHLKIGRRRIITRQQLEAFLTAPGTI